MAETAQIGRRVEDDRLLRGLGRYTDDFDDPAQGYAAFLRSDMAMGQLVSIYLDAAKALKGVRLVIGALDADALGLKPFASLGSMPEQKVYSRPVLARRIRHVGEIVAVVVADNPQTALDAIELIEATYGDDETAAEVAYLWRHGEFDAVEQELQASAKTVSVTARSNRVCVHPMETRGAFATFDRKTDIVTLVTDSQGAHKVRDSLAAVIGMASDKLRVVTPDVGGAFGVKLQAYPEQALVALAAKLTGAPVRWSASRRESSLMDAHGRAQSLKATLGFDNDGRITALRIENRADIGAYSTGFGAFTPSTSGGKVVGHAYRIPKIAIEVEASYSNTVPVDAYRGAGKPEMVYIVERAIEEAGRTLGIDPIEIRRRNLLEPGQLPHTMPLGQQLDSGDFPALLERVARLSDWRSFEERRAAAKARGRLAGIGVGLHMHVSGGFTNEHSLIRLSGGEIVVDTGSQAGGQGHETVFAQIVASILEIDVAKIRVKQGDTARLAGGGGTGGSSSVTISGVNIHKATTGLLERARARAADRLEAAVEDLEYGSGEFRVVGTDRRLAIFDLAEEDDLSFGCDYQGEHTTFPNGTYVAEVEIDEQTGIVEIVRFTGVDDIGRIINDDIAIGQIHGGIVQGLGQALWEHARYDENGQMLSATLMDYTLPRADDLGPLDCHFHPVPTAINPLGAKGVGELGPAGALAPIHHAVLDALWDYDTSQLVLPLTSESIWRVINAP